MVLERITINLSSIGDTTKKTINKTLAIGAAFTAAVILAPATFARDHHEPRPANGIQLATDIVNLVRAVIEPRPAPVIVKPAPTVVEKTVVVETGPAVVATQEVVTTVPGTVIVTGAEEIDIPEYSYVLYEDEYIPYYDGWLYIGDEWYWAGIEPRPAAPPRWAPPPRLLDRKPHKVIVLPDHHRGHGPAPVIFHREAPRHAPAPAVRHVPAPAIRHEAPRREPARTTVVRQEKKETKPAGTQKKDAPPAKKR